MKSNTLVKKVVVGTVFLLLGVLVFKIVEGFKDLDKTLEENLPTSRAFPTDYMYVLPKALNHKLTVKEVYNSTTRNPVAVAYLDNEFSLIMYKFDFTVDQGLRSLIKMEQADVDQTTGIPYAVWGSKNGKIKYRAGGEMLLTNILLTLEGVSIETRLIKDSVVSYSLKCKGFTIKYAENQPIDFLFESKYDVFRQREVPTLISFIKKNSNVFLVLVTSNDLNKNIPLDLEKQLLSNFQ